jgi:hypothetical protein
MASHRVQEKAWNQRPTWLKNMLVWPVNKPASAPCSSSADASVARLLKNTNALQWYVIASLIMSAKSSYTHKNKETKGGKMYA